MDAINQSLNRKIQLIIGALVFLISFAVYYGTMQPTTSFWDCGEYIACGKILGVMHPPGNPLLLLFFRIMTMIPLSRTSGCV